MIGKSIVAVGAHADDVEVGCFGSLARWAAKGAHVQIVVMSAGQTGDHAGVFWPDRTKEAIQAGQMIGASVRIGPFTNNRIEYNADSVQFLNRIFDEVEADTILTHWVGDNQSDHQATAKAAISAARKLPAILSWEPSPGRPPVQGVFRPQLFVDIEAHIGTKLQAIALYEGEKDRLGGSDHFHQWATRARLRGSDSGTKAAEAFEVVKLVDIGASSG